MVEVECRFCSLPEGDDARQGIMDLCIHRVDIEIYRNTTFLQLMPNLWVKSNATPPTAVWTETCDFKQCRRCEKRHEQMVQAWGVDLSPRRLHQTLLMVQHDAMAAAEDGPFPCPCGLTIDFPQCHVGVPGNRSLLRGPATVTLTISPMNILAREAASHKLP